MYLIIPLILPWYFIIFWWWLLHWSADLVFTHWLINTLSLYLDVESKTAQRETSFLSGRTCRRCFHQSSIKMNYRGSFWTFLFLPLNEIELNLIRVYSICLLRCFMNFGRYDSFNLRLFKFFELFTFNDWWFYIIICLTNYEALLSLLSIKESINDEPSFFFLTSLTPSSGKDIDETLTESQNRHSWIMIIKYHGSTIIWG